jgi:hypothetical protein
MKTKNFNPRHAISRHLELLACDEVALSDARQVLIVSDRDGAAWRCGWAKEESLRPQVPDAPTVSKRGF